MQEGEAEHQDIERVALLDEPARRRLYDFVSGQEAPVGRDRAAAETGMSRGLAAFHLDRLAEAGLLEVEFRRLTGKTGPGAGRPAKLYKRAERRLSVNLPASHYDLAGDLLASALEQQRPDESAAHAVRRVAGKAGRALARTRGATDSDAGLTEALAELGYEPEESPGGSVRLRNCPFHALAQGHTDLVCSMNEAFLKGVIEGLPDEELRARLDPSPGYCCVTIKPRG
jgi:predicted ArsR family transcriptional regulator